MKRFPEALLLGGLLLGALALRLYGIDWDQGHLFHPDERAILMQVHGRLALPTSLDLAQLLDPARSPLNPQWFPYGSLPLYLLKLSGEAVGGFLGRPIDLADLRLVGRAISALFDTGTVLLVYLLGRTLYGRGVGLLAASFVALAVLHVQQSHFFTADVILTFCTVLTLYAAALTMQRPTRGRAVLLGAALGLALASKVSAAPLALAVLAAYVVPLIAGKHTFFGWAIAARRALLSFGVALVVFFLAEPYALLDAPTFWADTIEQSEMVRRIRDYPYTRQYIDTPPYLYHIDQLTRWGLGPPLGVVAWGGLLLAVGAALFRRSDPDLLLLSWVLPYFLVTGSFEVKFLRYMLPVTPFLALMGARLLLGLRSWLLHPRAVDILVVAVLGWSAFYVLAYVQLYTAPHPAVQMSRWLNQNVPPGATILKEHWEEGLPNLGAYRQADLPLYEADTEEKLRLLARRLAGADYIVLFSNRLYGTIPRLPQRYPLSSAYYQLLFGEGLGYRLEHFSVAYPHLLGVSFVDNTLGRPGLPEPPSLAAFRPSPLVIWGGYADESFTVYDHPKVLLFLKVEPLTPLEVEARLRQAVGGAPLPGGPQPASPRVQPGLLMSPELSAANRAGGTWSEVFPRESPAQRYPVFFWLLLVQAAALAAFPLLFPLLRSLPDAGYLLAKGAGVLLLAYLPWLAASVSLLPYSRGAILGALGVLVALGGLAWLRSRATFAAVARQRWPLWLGGEALFLAAFGAFYLLRLANPDLWHPWRGGEKPMDFAYLNAVMRSTHFPAYDPWFAGGYLNYYYFGQVIIATLIKGTGIVPAVAYNLALPLLFALTVGMAFSLGYNLLALARGAPGRPARGAATIWGGLAAAFFLAMAGNLDGLLQAWEAIGRLSPLDYRSNLPGLAATVNAIAGLATAFNGQAPLPSFDYWRSSRMMPPTPNITEFPFFTFLFADLHAHLLALPFTLLALGAALSLLSAAASPAGGTPLSLFSWGRLLGLGFLAWVLGALRVSNSWDFPTYVLLAAAVVALAELVSFPRPSLGVFLRWGGQVALLYGLSTLLFWPFHAHYQLFYSGLQPSPESTPLGQYLAIHGLFLLLGVSFLLVELWHRFRGAPLVRGARLVLRHWERLPHLVELGRLFLRPLSPSTAWPLSLGGGFVILLAILAFGVSPLVASLVLLLGLTLLLALHELRTARPPSLALLFSATLWSTALTLSLGVELVTLQGDIGRMNTVFKFYLQIWVLYSITAAFALGYLLWPRPAEAPSRPVASRPQRRWGVSPQRLWGLALGVLVASSLLYPLLATPVRLRDRFEELPLTPDGMAFMSTAVYRDERGPIPLIWDYQALRWLQDHVVGSPVILEGNTPLYRWGSRISVYTGLPTVLGWDWHQKQQRWGYVWQVEERQREVAALFSSPDIPQTRALLEKYGVQYVYVGPVERLYYPRAGLAKFDGMVGSDLDLVYENPGVRIYQVRPRV